jgi:hypothetical protein
MVSHVSDLTRLFVKLYKSGYRYFVHFTHRQIAFIFVHLCKSEERIDFFTMIFTISILILVIAILVLVLGIENPPRVWAARTIRKDRKR